MLKKPSAILKGQLNRTHGVSTSRKVLDGSQLNEQRNSMENDELHSMSSLDKLYKTGFRSVSQFKAIEPDMTLVEKMIEKKVNEMSLFMSKTYSDAILTIKDTVKKLNSKYSSLSSQSISIIPIIEETKKQVQTNLEISEIWKSEAVTRLSSLEANADCLTSTVKEIYSRLDSLEKLYDIRQQNQTLTERISKIETTSKLLRHKIELREKKCEKCSEKYKEENARLKLEVEAGKENIMALAGLGIRVSAIETHIGALLPMKNLVRQTDSKMLAISKDQEVYGLRLEDLTFKMVELKKQLVELSKPKKTRSMTPKREKCKSPTPSNTKVKKGQYAPENLETLSSKIESGMRNPKTFDKIVSARKQYQKTDLALGIRNNSLPIQELKRDSPHHSSKSKKKEVKKEHSGDEYYEEPSKQINTEPRILNTVLGASIGTPKCQSVQSVSVTFLMDDDNFLRDKKGDFVIDDHGEKVRISEADLQRIDLV